MAAQSPSIDCDIVEPNGEVMVYVRGELDLVTLAEFEECLEGALIPRKDVFVDLSGAAFVDGRGIRSLFRAAERSRRQGRSFVVSTPSALLRRALISAPGAPDPPIVMEDH